MRRRPSKLDKRRRVSLEESAIADADLPSADMFIVAGDYFGALRIPLARGRLLTRRDGVEDPPTALVSASFAARYFPSADPIGRRIRLGTELDHGSWLTIVGVVGHVRSIGLDREADLAIYQSQATYVFHYTRLVARTVGDPSQFEGTVRAAIRSLDPLQPIFHVQPMDDYVSASIAERRFALGLIAAWIIQSSDETPPTISTCSCVPLLGLLLACGTELRSPNRLSKPRIPARGCKP